jgi:hypothetical protein
VVVVGLVEDPAILPTWKTGGSGWLTEAVVGLVEATSSLLLLLLYSLFLFPSVSVSAKDLNELVPHLLMSL